MKRILFAVDPQNDFINGALPVPGAEKALDALSDFLLANPERYAAKIVSLDFHPWNHSSFAANGGPWPKHCVAHSAGAAVFPRLLDALNGTGGETLFFRKGEKKDAEEYSIFANPDAADDLLALLREADVIDICGVAGDVCVLNTLKDGVRLLGKEKFNVLAEYSPSLDGGAKLAAFVESLR